MEFDGSEESVQETFRDRVVLDWHAASLIIKDLRLADSGAYELEATINNKKYYSQHEVVVIGKRVSSQMVAYFTMQIKIQINMQVQDLRR